jgi:DNA-binding transcriptional LysR family regulator
MLRVVDLSKLHVFRDIAQLGSLSRVAAEHGISQSAVTQQIQDLERTLGTPLLDRSHRPIRLTPAGELYLAFCRDTLRRYSEFEAALAALKAEPAGTVRVASIYSIGLSEMAEIEREFSRRMPQATLEVEFLRPEKVYRSVQSGDVDLGLVSYPEASRDTVVIPWRDEEMVVAVSPTHALAGRESVHPQELEGLDFIGFDDDLPIRRDVDRFLRDHGVHVNRVLHFDNLQMIKEAVAHNVGVSIMPARVLAEEVRQGRLEMITLDPPELSRPLGIVHRKRKAFHPVAKALLDLLTEQPPPYALP